MKMDCDDKSDEHHCTQIKIDESNYIMEYVPRDPSGKAKLEVKATFVVREIVEINEPEVRKLFASVQYFDQYLIWPPSDDLFWTSNLDIIASLQEKQKRILQYHLYY